MGGDRVVIGITGGSGSVLAVRLLERLNGVEKHLVMSENAKIVLKEEVGIEAAELEAQADQNYLDSDLSARISSGSFIFSAMVVIPCSMSTLAKISAGISDTLITRCAAVALKERRKLILVPREMPLSTIALENMHRLSLNGVIIAPAMPGYYTRPKTADDMVNFVVSRVMDLMGVENNLIKRWKQ